MLIKSRRPANVRSAPCMASSDSVEIAKVYFTGGESGDFCMVLGPVDDGQYLYRGQDFWTHFPDKKIFLTTGS